MNEKKTVPSEWEEDIKKGFNDAFNLTAKTEGTKGYFLGRRVHHGVVGGGVFALALKISSPYFVGYGLGLMLDDIGDIGQWLDFEKGGKSDSFISFEKK